MTSAQIVGVVLFVGLLFWSLFGDPLGRIRQLFGNSPAENKTPSAEEQAVIVRLRGSSLPPEVYAEHDVSTLEDQLRETIAEYQLGEYDGNEFGPEETVLYLYGPDAERLFAAVEPVLRAYPLCRKGIATIRRGPPGAPEREVSLA